MTLLPGMRFGARVVIALEARGKVRVRCDCGDEAIVAAPDLRRGVALSCRDCANRDQRGRRKGRGPRPRMVLGLASTLSEGMDVVGHPCRVQGWPELEGEWTVRGVYRGRLDLEQPTRVDGTGNTMPARTALHVPMGAVEVLG